MPIDTAWRLHETFATVRVIGGALGGRRLRAPKGLETRPTSDRVREALFMSLEPLAGAYVVDLFSGSGAMGIEALSRGAVHVDFVEAAGAARRVLAENLQTLGIETRATIWPLHLPQGFKRLAGPLAAADLVLLDPPYGGEIARATLAKLGAGAELRAGARVVVEHHRRDVMPEACGALVCTRSRRYGETIVTTYEVPAVDATVPGGQA